VCVVEGPLFCLWWRFRCCVFSGGSVVFVVECPLRCVKWSSGAMCVVEVRVYFV
jgi:hypothetical protein